MTAEDRLALVAVKVERAKKHIIELDREIAAFYATNPYEIASKVDAQTTKPIWYIERANPVPISLSAITGDVIQNLRSALDHLAQQLYIVATGLSGEDIHFPIDSDAEQLKNAVTSSAKVKGLRQDAKNAILAAEPYKRGKGHDLWVLNKLNRIDKHRLVLAVYGNLRSTNVAGDMREIMAKNWRATGIEMEVPEFELWIRPADRMCGLKAGDQLYTGMAGGEAHKKMDFRLSVALNEPGIIECEPLIESLVKFTDLVSSTIVAFRPCLA